MLEQRIARVHRLGQKRNVQVINLVASNTIEQRMLDVLKFKSSLFGGILDNGEDQIFMGESKFKKFMQSVEQMTRVEKKFKPDIEEQTQLFEPSESNARAQAAVQLFTTTAQVFGTLAQTFAGQQTTFEKDANGKAYLKIPIENQEILTKGLSALQGFLNSIQGRK